MRLAALLVRGKHGVFLVLVSAEVFFEGSCFLVGISCFYINILFKNKFEDIINRFYLKVYF